MAELSLIEKLKILFNAILNSPLFLVCTFLGIFLMVLMILDILVFKKMNRKISIMCWIVVVGLVIIRYAKAIWNLSDNLIENIFQALYFPNYIVYTIILLITNFYFLYTFFKKGIRRLFKIIGVVNFIVVNILFIIVIETLISNKINIYDEINIYTNSTLTVSLQLTTAFFTSMLLFYLLLSAYYKSKRFDETGVKYNYKRKLPPIIFDEKVETNASLATHTQKVFVWKIIKGRR